LLDVRGGEVRETSLDPATYGIEKASREDLRGGDATEAARIARAILAGEEGPRRDVVLLNAGAALVVAGVAADLHEGIALAAASIDEGKSARTLERWVAVSTAATGGSE
jgi:anthranilate phosphoribosyltransferase